MIHVNRKRSAAESPTWNSTGGSNTREPASSTAPDVTYSNPHAPVSPYWNRIHGGTYGYPTTTRVRLLPPNETPQMFTPHIGRTIPALRMRTLPLQKGQT